MLEADINFDETIWVPKSFFRCQQSFLGNGINSSNVLNGNKKCIIRRKKAFVYKNNRNVAPEIQKIVNIYFLFFVHDFD